MLDWISALLLKHNRRIKWCCEKGCKLILTPSALWIYWKTPSHVLCLLLCSLIQATLSISKRFYIPIALYLNKFVFYIFFLFFLLSSFILLVPWLFANLISNHNRKEIYHSAEHEQWLSLRVQSLTVLTFYQASFLLQRKPTRAREPPSQCWPRTCIEELQNTLSVQCLAPLDPNLVISKPSGGFDL